MEVCKAIKPIPQANLPGKHQNVEIAATRAIVNTRTKQVDGPILRLNGIAA